MTGSADVVAYSFKRRFVTPIQVGLGIQQHIPGTEFVPKRQTIRADRRRHARPGEELQLYCGMRTKGCFLIGRARCLSIVPVRIDMRRETINADGITFAGMNLNGFAQADGFPNWMEMRNFWREEHGVLPFRGVLIRWEPLP